MFDMYYMLPQILIQLMHHCMYYGMISQIYKKNKKSNIKIIKFADKNNVYERNK